jgi:hypothetical protein
MNLTRITTMITFLSLVVACRTDKPEAPAARDGIEDIAYIRKKMIDMMASVFRSELLFQLPVQNAER